MIESFIQKLEAEQAISFEISPGHLPTLDPIIEKIKAYGLDKKVDAFTTTDNPLAKLKYNATLAAVRLQQSFNLPVIATMAMRDKNRIALQSELLGANDFDVRGFLALTGDPVRLSDQAGAKGVFESRSTMLLEIIAKFNQGFDYCDKEFKVCPKPIYPFSVVNSYANNMSSLEKKIYKKVEAGSFGIMTQPVYDVEVAKELLSFCEKANADLTQKAYETKMILGFLPVVRFRTAKFLYEKLPGVYIPDTWLEKLEAASKLGEEEERKVGYELSKTLFEELKAYYPKIHFMTANNISLASELLS